MWCSVFSFTFYVDFYFPNLTIFQLSCHLLIRLAHVHSWLLQRNSSFRCNLSSSPFSRKFGRHLDVNVAMVSPFGRTCVPVFIYCFFIAKRREVGTLYHVSSVSGVSARTLDLTVCNFLVGYFQFVPPTSGTQASRHILMLQQIHEAETQ